MYHCQQLFHLYHHIKNEEKESKDLVPHDERFQNQEAKVESDFEDEKPVLILNLCEKLME